MKQGDEYLFTHNNEQKYTTEQVKNMIIEWEEESEKLKEFVDRYDEIFQTTMNDIKVQYDSMVKKITQDLESRKEKSELQIKHNEDAIKLWKNPE